MHFCSNLRTDPRKSVQLLAEKAMETLGKRKKGASVFKGMIDFEREIAGSTIYGIDEAGRGPLAGTSCGGSCHYAAVMEKFRMSNDCQAGLRKREQLYEQILKEAVSYG